MINLNINQKNEPLKILCLGAHSDDIEIGCGGTILSILTEYPHSEVHWHVFSANEIRKQETLESSGFFLEKAENKQVCTHDFKESYFPYHASSIKDEFEKLKEILNPDIIFSHCRTDLHQDHELISKLTLNTFRNHLILEYEIPKYDGDLGNPNLFIPIDDKVLDYKLSTIIQHFKSQRSRNWFSKETFRALPVIRGIECNSPSGYAEAFYCRKCILRFM